MSGPGSSSTQWPRHRRWRLGLSAGLCALLLGSAGARAQVVYSTDFDSLTIGPTEPYPGAAGQDGWYLDTATAPSYGEIQDVVTTAGNALHEYTDISNLNGQATVDRRDLTPPDLSANPIILFRADFSAHTSDLLAINPYGASLSVNDGPYPVFQMIGFVLQGGNGAPKQDTGVKVVLYYFNGVDNNGPIPLSVGYQLAWDTWHHIEVIADQSGDTYVSVTVDGQTQDITGYQLPRNNDGSGNWVRGQDMEFLSAAIAPHEAAGDDSSDDVYWDNIGLQVALFYDGFETGNFSRWSAVVGGSPN